jgi:hypothetical protein
MKTPQAHVELGLWHTAHGHIRSWTANTRNFQVRLTRLSDGTLVLRLLHSSRRYIGDATEGLTSILWGLRVMDVIRFFFSWLTFLPPAVNTAPR